MTADEMFRELGYREVWHDKESITYARGTDEYEKIVVRKVNQYLIVSCTSGGEADGFMGKEILACAQLIKEMEEQK